MSKQQNASQTNSPASQRGSARTKRGKTSAVSDEQNNETILLPAPARPDNETSLLRVNRSNTENGAHLQKAEMETERSAANIAKGCLPTSFREIMFSIVIFASFSFAFLRFKDTGDEMLVYVILLLVGRYLGIKVVDLLPSIEKFAEIIHTLASKD